MTPPIPSPEPTETTVYFWVSTRFAAIIVAIMLIGLVAVELDTWLSYGITRWSMEWEDVLLVTIIFSTLGSFLMPVAVNSQRVYGPNAWGLRRSIRWNEITDIQPTNFYKFEYLKLSTVMHENLIWLPLFLADRQGFLRAVQDFAAPDNPLRSYLEQA